MKERYLILILVILVLGFLFFSISGSNLKKNLDKVESYDTKIKVAQEKLNSSRIMDEQLSQFALIIDNSLSRSVGFTFDEINEFKKRIGEMAHERKITINKLSDSNKFSLPGLVETTYNLELEATFIQMGQFVSDLEAQDNIIKIQAIDISPAQTTDKDKQTVDTAVSRYRITMELSVFKVKREA